MGQKLVRVLFDSYAEGHIVRWNCHPWGTSVHGRKILRVFLPGTFVTMPLQLALWETVQHARAHAQESLLSPPSAQALTGQEQTSRQVHNTDRTVHSTGTAKAKPGEQLKGV